MDLVACRGTERASGVGAVGWRVGRRRPDKRVAVVVHVPERERVVRLPIRAGKAYDGLREAANPVVIIRGVVRGGEKSRISTDRIYAVDRVCRFGQHRMSVEI